MYKDPKPFRNPSPGQKPSLELHLDTAAPFQMKIKPVWVRPRGGSRAPPPCLDGENKPFSCFWVRSESGCADSAQGRIRAALCTRRFHRECLPSAKACREQRWAPLLSLPTHLKTLDVTLLLLHVANEAAGCEMSRWHKLNSAGKFFIFLSLSCSFHAKTTKTIYFFTVSCRMMKEPELSMSITPLMFLSVSVSVQIELILTGSVSRTRKLWKLGSKTILDHMSMFMISYDV